MAQDTGDLDDPGADGNLTEITVSELAGAIKRTVEDAFGLVRLRGEVSGYRGPHSSGHCYFALKDEGARIDAVIWKGTFQRLKVKPEEGLEVIATGRVTTYPGRSAYQIVIERIEPAGLGALMALLEERRRKLAAEGLFDEARKKPLPYLPRVIGVVTSPTGAVIRDILHRLADRFPVHVLVWPVRVQGETSGPEVAAAIAGFNALGAEAAVPAPDVIIVARGGGSLEDLWGFNDEAVVRAVAASRIPVISAVGHETDWTLIDHAADRRAPTPTAAAEFAVPVRVDLAASLREAGARLARSLARQIAERRARLAAAARVMPRREALFETQRQRLDRAADALARGREAAIGRRRERLAALTPRLSSRPLNARILRDRERILGLGRRKDAALRRGSAEGRRRLEAFDRRMVAALRRGAAGARLRLDQTAPRLAKAGRRVIGERRQALAGLVKLAASLGYKRVLARGYAVVRAGEDVVSGVAAAHAAGAVAIEFADGVVGARIGEAVPGAAGPDAQAKPARTRRRREDQGTLF